MLRLPNQRYNCPHITTPYVRPYGRDDTTTTHTHTLWKQSEQ